MIACKYKNWIIIIIIIIINSIMCHKLEMFS
jgi:hypothetical protein